MKDNDLEERASRHPQLSSIETKNEEVTQKLANPTGIKVDRRSNVPEDQRTRDLGWMCQGGEMIPVWEMTDTHLTWAIELTRQRITTGQLITGHTSLSQLTLDYLIAEAMDRNISLEE
jgi:hypothetical protein